MLMAAGMNAQQREVKLSRNAEEAKEAWLVEIDPEKSSKLQIIWKEAEDRLERFQTQQVAGGEDPSQDGGWQHMVHLVGGTVRGPATKADGAPRA